MITWKGHHLKPGKPRHGCKYVRMFVCETSSFKLVNHYFIIKLRPKYLSIKLIVHIFFLLGNISNKVFMNGQRGVCERQHLKFEVMWCEKGLKFAFHIILKYTEIDSINHYQCQHEIKKQFMLPVSCKTNEILICHRMDIFA